MDIQESEWYQSRPPHVQRRIDEYPPNYLYRNVPANNQMVVIYSYEERDGQCDTCKVQVLRKYNPHIFIERTVFGVPFTSLERLQEATSK
jgi:hypothetical protein